MNCEVCGLTPEQIKEIGTCLHNKNGYCYLFLQQAEKDKNFFGPKNYKTLADLQPGDTFRYKGSDENDWHTVSRVDEEKLYYTGYLPDKPQSNYRTDNVQVICKNIS